MITLNLTPQEAKQRILQHFSQEGAQYGYDHSTMKCQYRTDRGAACAVGCLVSDEEAATLPCGSVTALKSFGALSMSVELLTYLQSAQNLHDRCAHGDISMKLFVEKLRDLPA